MTCENSTQTITLLVVGVQLSLLIYLLNIAWKLLNPFFFYYWKKNVKIYYVLSSLVNGH